MNREQELLNRLTKRIGETPDGDQLSRDAFQSRFHFQRTFRESVGETPVRLLRRLNLERAAFSLRSSDKSVIQIALDSGFQSHAGFTRAFKKAFQLSPREYRGAARRIRELPGRSGLHFDPNREDPLYEKGIRKMDLTDRLLQRDLLAKRRLLECARLLTDRQLDAPLAFRHTLAPFVEPTRTLRESLQGLIWSQWVDGMLTALNFVPKETGYRTNSGESVEQLATRFESYHVALREFVEHVRRENLWDTEWVDDTCDEPHTFAIGQVIEEQLTWDIAGRLMLQRQFEAMGFEMPPA